MPINLLALSKAQLRQLRDKKYTYAMNSDGTTRKITYKDLWVDNETLERIKKDFPFDKEE